MTAVTALPRLLFFSLNNKEREREREIALPVRDDAARGVRLEEHAFQQGKRGECNIYYDCGKVDTLIPVSFSL